MTPQEVKKKLWLLRNKYECLTYQEAEKISISNAEFVEALDMAIKALEKQIPKKAEYKIVGNGWNDWAEGRCPVCGAGTKNTPIYCPVCGQAIDWSDTE